MRKKMLFYCAGTNTIRQSPENYLIAGFDNNYRYWVCDNDGAADKKLAVKVFLALFEYDNKYQRDGNLLVEAANKIEI